MAKERKQTHENPAEIGLNPKVQERLALINGEIRRLVGPLEAQKIALISGVCLQNGVDLTKVDYTLSTDGTKLVRGKPKGR